MIELQTHTRPSMALQQTGPATPSSAPSSSAPLSPKASQAIAAAKSVAAREVPAVKEQALQNAVAEQVPELKTVTGAKLQLDIDQDSGRVIGRIVDRASGTLIRQIPSDEMLRLIAQTKEMLGAFYDSSV